jgi:predicted RNA methylase
MSAADLLDRRRILGRALREVGYTDNHIRFEWPVSDREALRRGAHDDDQDSYPSGSPRKLDVVAFYDERQRSWDTTAFVAELNRTDLVQQKESGLARAKELFELTASPCSLFSGNGRADLWVQCWEDHPQLIGDIPYSESDLSNRFRQHRRQIEREALERLRGGQRYLFDGVYEALREDLVQFLHRGISKAIWLAPSLLRNGPGEEENEKDRQALSRIAIGLMAARILEDKGYFGTAGQTSDARQILGMAEGRANGFFREAIKDDTKRLEERLGTPIVEGIFQRLMAHLTGPASFSMVTAEMLGYLYETALLADRRQRGSVTLNGIHYTPRSLAEQILSRIPVEEFRVSQRLVLDMACGSGSFILAATERLRQAYDPREAGAERNLIQHLQRHVVGNDIDPIAILVTRLAYLLEHWVRTGEPSNPPEPARLWQTNGLALSASKFPEGLPSVIVGNPPFGGQASGQQRANQFLEKSLDLLSSPGYLGIVMPGPFLKQRRDQSAPTRERLLRECELIEIWEQPLGTVGLTARQETCVVIARKRPEGNRRSQAATLFKLTYSSKKSAVRALQEHLRTTFTFVASGLPGRAQAAWIDDAMHRIIASPVDTVWRKIDLENNVGALCETALGLKALLSKAKFSAHPQEGFRPYLRTQGNILPYFLEKEHWASSSSSSRAYIDPSSAGHRPKEKSWPLFQGLKIVLTNNTNRNCTCQLRAAFDEHGVYPDGDIACLALRDPASVSNTWAGNLLQKRGQRELLLWLAAVLNGPVANAWIATAAPPRAIPEEVRLTLPLPSCFDRRIPKLVEKTLHARTPGDPGFEIWEPLANTTDGTADLDFQSLVAQINALVLESYGLSRQDGKLLHTYLKGMTEPWAEGEENAYRPLQGVAYRRIGGTVLSVDVKRQQVVVDIRRYTKKAGQPLKIPLPRHMPGWALREGAEFTCLAPSKAGGAEDLQNCWLLRDFQPLSYSYLQPQEIEEMIGFQPASAGT